jgi:hypothetical protein
MFFHLLKTYIRNLSLFFISFSPFYLEVNDDANHDSSAHICAGRWVLPSWFANLLKTIFSYFIKIRWMSSCSCSIHWHHTPCTLFRSDAVRLIRVTRRKLRIQKRTLHTWRLELFESPGNDKDRPAFSGPNALRARSNNNSPRGATINPVPAEKTTFFDAIRRRK